MLIHYFLTGLKPIKIDGPTPIDTKEFMLRAKESLNEKIISDLNKLHIITDLDKAIGQIVKGHSFNKDDWESIRVLNEFHLNFYLKELKTYCPQVLRRLFWNMIQKDCKSNFLHTFSKNAVNFYEVLAALIAKKNFLLKSFYERELNGQLDSTAKIILKNFDSFDFSLAGRHTFLGTMKSMLDKDDPIALEHYIAKYFFNFIDNEVSLDQFHSDHVFAYYLKLVFKKRLSSFNKDEGLSVLNGITHDIDNKLLGMIHE